MKKDGTLSLRRSSILALAFAVSAAAGAAANQWNDRTVLKFSDPVIVPGATLEPGSYVFKLTNSDSNRHLVQILEEDTGEVVTLTQAIPTRRADAKGDVVLKLNPTDEGTPPAIEAWFYPGSLYGHRFVYPDDQARQIAQRTKTLVLSTDVEGSDFERGTLYTYDASGTRRTWTEDANVNREWHEWRQSSAADPNATAAVHKPATGEQTASTAPMIQGDRNVMEVQLDQLEENTQQYIGKTVSVDGEVEEVLGPRIFTIDEPHWGDLDGELLVFMPTHLVALVQDDDQVTVTGTVKPFVRADFEREWGWFDLTPELEADLALKPVLVANRIVGGNSDIAMVIRRTPAAGGTESAVGTGGSSKESAGEPAGSTGVHVEPIDSVDELADARPGMVGRRVKLSGVAVTGPSRDGKGFFIRSTGGTSVFVLPAEERQVAKDSRVSLEGVVLQMPSRMREKLDPSGDWNEAIYVMATDIR